MLDQRLNLARQLLANTTPSVKEVAASVGCEDPAYFWRVFSEQMQLSPFSYRAANKWSSRWLCR